MRKISRPFAVIVCIWLFLLALMLIVVSLYGGAPAGCAMVTRQVQR